MIRHFILSFAVALLVAHCSSAPATIVEAPSEQHLEDSKIYNIRPLLFNAPKTQKNVRFSAELESAGRTMTNAELFEKLGLQKLHISSGQQKKRLAVQSRHHGHPDDSNMFIIKLPPNQAFYGNSKSQSNSPNSIQDEHSRKVNMNFQSNGKLGAIYHWNLPVLKKMLEKNHHKSHHNSYYRHAGAAEDEELLDIKNIPTWSDPWNESHADKQYQEELEKKYKKKKAPVYYAPAKKNKKVQKYFPGNGKPKSFYVMQKSKSPSFYQKLIA